MAVLTGVLLSIGVLAAASLAALAPTVVYRTRGAIHREAMQRERTAQWERDRGAAARDRRADYEAARAATPAHDTDVPPTSQGGVEQDMPGHEGPSHSQPTAPQDDGAEPPRPYPRPRPPTCDQEQPTGPFRNLFGYENSFCAQLVSPSRPEMPRVRYDQGWTEHLKRGPDGNSRLFFDWFLIRLNAARLVQYFSTEQLTLCTNCLAALRMRTYRACCHRLQDAYVKARSTRSDFRTRGAHASSRRRCAREKRARPVGAA
jgi:hypothetical protein